MRTRCCFATIAAAVQIHASWAQAIPHLTLAEAEQRALRNHPRVASANLLALASKSAVTQARAAFYPTLGSNFTAAGADHNTTVSAGSLPTSSLYSRLAAGITLSQAVSDFGRTANLAEAAKLRASAQEQSAVNTRAGVLIEVDQSFYQALAADTVLRVAEAVADNRRLTLRQISALAQSSLKSTLDVSFAEVAVSEAELAVVRSENDAQASRDRLSAALGASQDEKFVLDDEPLPPSLEPEPETLVAQAIQQRPDLAALRLTRDSAHRFADAEKDLSRPTISLVGVAGVLPAADPRLRSTYAAAGVNVSVPVFNGGLYSARRSESAFRALAADKDVEDLAVQISRQVRVAWLEANTAFRRLDVTARLVTQADQSLRLAQIRYDNGLGSMVELNQAQLTQVSAEIAAAGAKYDYLSRRAAINFVVGGLR